jgi:hypothetical protein
MANRISRVRKHLDSFATKDDLRKEILNALSITHDLPEVGNFYTFLHIPEKKIIYDQYPLVATTKIQKWGFDGINFHSKGPRSYKWNSVKSKYHVVKQDELEDLLELQYGKHRLNR